MPSDPPAGRPARRAPAAATAAEVAAMFALLTSYIWLWQGTFPGDRFLVVALYAAIGLETHWRHGESARALGFRLDNLGRFLRLAAAWLALPLALGLAAGRALGGWSFPAPSTAAAGLLWSVAWGAAQEYGLVCVFYRRLRDLLPRRTAAPAAAAVFAALHLPNPLLVGLTLLMGLLACHLYERHPSVPGLGIAHGAASFLLANALPRWLTLDWQVGPQVLQRGLAMF